MAILDMKLGLSWSQVLSLIGTSVRNCIFLILLAERILRDIVQ
jgi:hypothetical protein